MKKKSNAIKYLVMVSVLGVGLFAQRDAQALSCVNDDDCPGAECGGEVCDWVTKGLTCTPAGGAAKGADGWCTDDTDCKCRSLGATCDRSRSFCTFTLPSQAPGATASGGASGTNGGAPGNSGGASGSSGGAPGSGGASSGNDGGAQPAKDDGGGCSVMGGGAASGLGAAIALLGLMVLGRRRRR